MKNSRGGKKWWQVTLLVILLAAWTFVAVVGSEFLISLFLRSVLPAEALTSPLANAIFTVIVYGLAIVLTIYLPPIVLKKWVKKPSSERLGLRGLPTWTDIGLAPVGYVVSIGFAMGLTLLFNLFPWFNSGQGQELGYSIYMQGWERGIAFVALVVIAPIAEELIFRGWLYGKLRVKIPKVLAILVVSLTFALIHMQWNVGISVFAMSVVTCSLREVTGNIYAGTLVHMLNNGIAFYLTYIAMMG